MVDAVDLKISRRMQRFLARVEKLAAKEFGMEVGISLCVHPFAKTAQDHKVQELQYVSNLPRAHMHEAFRMLVKKWDAGGIDVPPHQRE